MKNIRSIVIILFMASITINTYAQSDMKALQIGDQVPDLEFTNLINSEKTAIKLSDYKGKLIILDFFATWCVPCVRALPHLDSLQRQFKDEIVILPITNEKDSLLSRFLDKRPHLKLSLSYITDTNLQEYFPFRSLPLEVWIDRDGRLMALTDGESVTAENIRKVLTESSAVLPEKQDILDWDGTKPFMAGFFGSYKLKSQQILFSSILTEGFEGLPSMSRSGPIVENGMSVLTSSNNYITRLYWMALLDVTAPFPPISKEFFEKKEFYKQMVSRVVWEAKDSSLFWSRATVDNMSKKPYKDKFFNYELRMPTTDNDTFRKTMLTDLNRYFGTVHKINGRLEKRRVKCYALKAVGPESLFKTKGGKPLFELKEGVNNFKIANYQIDAVMFFWLNWHIPYFEYPIVNETNYDGPVDFDLGEVDTKDFYAVNNALKKFGLEFQLVERDLDMLVFRDMTE